MKSSEKIVKAIKKTATKVMKKAKLGSGKRFAAVIESAKASGAKNPAAVAAMVGMKKYGKAKMMKMALAGKKKASKK